MRSLCLQWFQRFPVAGRGVTDWWEVRFTQGQGASCTCPAHEHRGKCKHVERVLREACLWASGGYAGGRRVRVPEPGLASPTGGDVSEGQRCPACGGPLVVLP